MLALILEWIFSKFRTLFVFVLVLQFVRYFNFQAISIYSIQYVYNLYDIYDFPGSKLAAMLYVCTTGAGRGCDVLLRLKFISQNHTSSKNIKEKRDYRSCTWRVKKVQR